MLFVVQRGSPMMPTLNLLPWREWRQKRRNRQFLLQLAAVLMVALLILGAAGRWVQGAIEVQEGRNALLREQITELDGRIAEVHRLRQRRDASLAQIDAIQFLETQRTTVVRIFDALANTLPDGVHYRAVERKGDVLALTGVATSGADVAALIRNLQGSATFAETRLISIEEAKNGTAFSGAARVFHLTTVRVAPCMVERDAALASPASAQPCRQMAENHSHH